MTKSSESQTTVRTSGLSGPRPSAEFDDRRRRMEHSRRAAFEAHLMRVVGRAMERASWATCRHTGAWLGLLFFNAMRSRRNIAIANVRLAFPDLSEAAARQIARRSAQNFGMMFCEFLHLPAASAQEVREYVDPQGIEHVQAGLEQGRGVILLVAHLGNWEVMGARAVQEFPMSVVARPRSNSGVEEHILEIRQAAGFKVISKFDTGRAALKALRANETVAILPDQHAGPEGGLLLPMFGHLTRFVPALARLALLADAPVVPSFGVRRTPWLADGRIIATMSPGFHVRLQCRENGTSHEGRKSRDSRDPAAREAAVVEGTRRVIHEIENVVRHHPDQWLWMHRRWRAEDSAEQTLSEGL